MPNITESGTKVLLSDFIYLFRKISRLWKLPSNTRSMMQSTTPISPLLPTVSETEIQVSKIIRHICKQFMKYY